MQKTIRATTLALGTFALAGFCGSANAQWTLSNVGGGDGTLLDGSYPTFTIVGANDGSGNDNTTFYTTTFTTSTFVTFAWAFNTTDVTGGTTYDQGGYIVGIDEHLLSVLYPDDTASSGTISSLLVPANTTFGFWVHTADSEGGPGYLAINEPLPVLSSPPPPPPPPPPAIPEPGNAALMMAGLAALFAAARRRNP
jgi:MYXO-CTERM domain-containing protein